MSVTVTPHLNFRGDARAALDFYASVFGGHAFASTYGSLGMPDGLPDTDKVVFGQAEAPNGFRVMAYDIPASSGASTASTFRENGMTITDLPFFVSVQGDTLEEVTEHWSGLADGATIIEPLAASAWSPGFGMLADRFGVTWVVGVRPAD